MEVFEIYEDFLKKYGKHQQLLQSVEEMTELNKEILKFIRYDNVKDTKELVINIIEELGDVYNALDSLIHIFEIDKSVVDINRYNKLLKYHNTNVKGTV